MYEVENLATAREYLAASRAKVVLTNPAGSTKYYGMHVVDCIFKKLQREFPNKISDIIVNIYDDYPAFIKARDFGYRKINFTMAD